VSRRSSLIPIVLVVLVDVLGLTIVIPLISIYAESFNASPFVATLLVPTYAVCQLFSGPLLGRISDRTGRRPMLLVSQLGTFLGFLLMARATSLWMVFGARVIDGSTAGNLSLAQAYISDHTRPEERTGAFAWIGIAFGTGFLIGPAITAALAGYGLAAPIYAAAALSFTSILCTFFLLPRDKPEAPKAPVAGPGGQRLGLLGWGAYAQFFRRPVLGGLLVQFLLYMLAFQTFTSGFALFAERTFTWHGHAFTPREIGVVFAFVGALGILLQGGVIGRLAKRFGEARLTAWGFASLVVGYLLLGFSHQISMLLLAATVLSFGNGALRPTLTTLVTVNASRSEQGVVLGLTQSLSSVASIAAPPLAGYLIGSGFLGPWAWVAGALALVGAIARRWGSSRGPAAAGGVSPGTP